MPVHQYWHGVLRRVWILAIFLVLGAGAAVLAGRLVRPQYQSTASLWLNPATPNASVGFVNLIGPMAPADRLTQLATTYGAYMKTPLFLTQVTKRLQGQPASGVQHASVGALANALTTSLTPNTNLFNVAATWPTPQGSRAIAAAAAAAFLASSKPALVGTSAPAAATAELERSAQFLSKRIAVVEGAMERRTRDLTQRGQQALLSTDAQLARLEQELLPLQGTYTGILSALAGATGSNTSGGNAAQLASPASASVNVGSSLGKNLIVAELIAALLALTCIVVLIYNDSTIFTANDLGAYSGAPVLGSIERVRRRGMGGGRRAAHPAASLVVLHQPGERACESLRQIAVSLNFIRERRGLRSFVVTGAESQDGASFVAANLAASLAMSGVRVILVDVDRHASEVSRAFGLPETGVQDAGTGLGEADMPVTEEAVQQRLRPTHVEGLQVLPSGQLPADSTTPLASGHAVQMLRLLPSLADVVVYDTPPISLLADATVVAGWADGVILVARAGVTRGERVADAVEGLRQIGAAVVGCVLNQVPPGSIGRYSDVPPHSLNGSAAPATRGLSRA